MPRDFFFCFAIAWIAYSFSGRWQHLCQKYMNSQMSKTEYSTACSKSFFLKEVDFFESELPLCICFLWDPHEDKIYQIEQHFSFPHHYVSLQYK